MKAVIPMWFVKWNKHKVKTIWAILIFERDIHKYIMVVNTYHTYNGIFNAKDFIQEMLKSYHKIYICGTVSPHHIGVVE